MKLTKEQTATKQELVSLIDEYSTASKLLTQHWSPATKFQAQHRLNLRRKNLYNFVDDLLTANPTSTQQEPVQIQISTTQTLLNPEHCTGCNFLRHTPGYTRITGCERCTRTADCNAQIRPHCKPGLTKEPTPSKDTWRCSIYQLRLNTGPKPLRAHACIANQ